MRNYIKHWFWFVKESHSFLGEFKLISLYKAFRFAKSMCAWDKLTPEQREAWYLSGEGRTLYFH
jgi:hypothetical protein